MPKQTLLVGIIAAWAAAMFGLAGAQNVLTASISFFFGGLIYAPFTPIAYSYLQSFLTEEDEQPVITLWSTASALAAPIGLVTAGPLIYFAIGGPAFRDLCVEPLAAVGEALGVPGVGTAAAHTTRNKDLCRARLREAGLPQPASLPADHEEQARACLAEIRDRVVFRVIPAG
ncbi:hypothetical protein OG422_19805 [Streptomyces sp. NBC_01525]|uniref:hypothetical protein n=1 Tax=Streptomyces sp. NBC_01525 TaxID=2903893 RepID=UPI00386C6221